MRSYWQSTWLGRTIIATMFAVATVELPLAPVQPGRSDHPSVSRALIRLGSAILLIFIGVFSTLVLWLNGVVLNGNYLLLPALLLMCAARGNLLLRAVQKGLGSALPG